MLRCGYCKMRLSRCHCRRQKPDAEIKRRAEVDLPSGQTTLLCRGPVRFQLRWWRNISQQVNLDSRRQAPTAPALPATPPEGPPEARSAVRSG